MVWTRRGVVGSLAGFSLAPQTARAQNVPSLKHVALCVGVQAYDKLNKLTRPVADAVAMTRVLQSIGYSADSLLDPDRKQLGASMERFVGGIAPDSSAIFFFAGHGFQSGGANYLTTRDTTPTEKEIYNTAYPLNELLEQMAARRPRQGIIILDACRNQPWVAGTLSQRQGFSGIQAPNGFYIVYSAGSGEFALDDLGEADKHPNSVFTRAFVGCVRPDISIGEAVKTARTEVIRLAASVDHPQHPATYDQTAVELTLRGDPVTTHRIVQDYYVLPSTVTLAIAQDRTGDEGAKYGPHADQRLIYDRLGSLSLAGGASVTSSMETDTANSIRDNLESLAEHSAGTLIVYWSADGGYYDVAPGTRDAFFCFYEPRGKHPPELISLSEVIAKLKSPKRRLLILANIGLPPLQVRGMDDKTLKRVALAASRKGGAQGALGLLMNPAVDDVAKTEALGRTAVLFAGSLDAPFTPTDGRSCSPFATAVSNALGRPGVSLRDFARLVRDDVESITRGRQSPVLLGVESAMTPLVRVRQRQLL